MLQVAQSVCRHMDMLVQLLEQLSTTALIYFFRARRLRYRFGGRWGLCRWHGCRGRQFVSPCDFRFNISHQFRAGDQALKKIKQLSLPELREKARVVENDTSARTLSAP
jgi:hypothetical protein